MCSLLALSLRLVVLGSLFTVVLILGDEHDECVYGPLEKATGESK